jgi:hypothetical protein
MKSLSMVTYPVRWLAGSRAGSARISWAWVRAYESVIVVAVPEELGCHDRRGAAGERSIGV